MATIATPAAQAGPAGAASHLKANTLNLFDTTVIATSSVAPAYTIAQTSFLLVAGFMRFVGHIAWWKSLLTSFVFAIAMFVTFDIAFDVIMPKGPLEALFGH